MPRLRILPGNIANMIAAGEVVQRPASVVKELLENAVDAGAGSITVVLSDAGRTLVQVIDNGCGMSPEDALVCFERHATSKIATEEDLANIMTYGFRGEALSSISSVAEVTLKTRRQGDELATQVQLTDFKHAVTSRCSAPVGSSFAVRNLFFNVPARRKFLKSDNIELKHCIEEFSRVALTRPDIGFTLTHNGKNIYVLKPAKSLKFRVQDIMGPSLAGEMVDISTETSVVKISGFVGRPDTARKTLGNQFLFVNGRFFRSPYLHKAVMKAYEEFIPEGVTPSYFIYLETDPSVIDVNIHPTKTEIKFEDDSVIFQILYASVKESLGRNSFGASIDFEGAGAVDVPVIGKNFDRYREMTVPSAAVDPNYNPFDEGKTDFESPSGNAGAFPAGGIFRGEGHPQGYGRLFEEKQTAGQCITVNGKYVVTRVKDGLMVVNVRRARERILYEQFLAALDKGENVTQISLFPVQVRVGAANRLVFEDNAAALAEVGFDIASFGNDAVVVNGLPSGFNNDSADMETLVSDLLLILSEQKGSLREMLNSAKAARLALLGASGQKPLSSPFEAQRLLDALFNCSNTELTPGGKRIAVIIDAADIDRKFEQIQ